MVDGVGDDVGDGEGDNLGNGVGDNLDDGVNGNVETCGLSHKSRPPPRLQSWI